MKCTSCQLFRPAWYASARNWRNGMHSVLRYHVSVISVFKRLAHISPSIPVSSQLQCRMPCIKTQGWVGPIWIFQSTIFKTTNYISARAFRAFHRGDEATRGLQSQGPRSCTCSCGWLHRSIVINNMGSPACISMVPREAAASPRALGSTLTRIPASRKIFELPSAPVDGQYRDFPECPHFPCVGASPVTKKGTQSCKNPEKSSDNSTCRHLPFWVFYTRRVKSAAVAECFEHVCGAGSLHRHINFNYPHNLSSCIVSSRYTKLHRPTASLNWAQRSQERHSTCRFDTSLPQNKELWASVRV